MEEKKVIVSGIDLGKRWPLIVESGTILNRDLAIIFRDETGKEYALNGTAKMRKNKKKQFKYLDINPIWKTDLNNSEFKISITPLIAIGLAL